MINYEEDSYLELLYLLKEDLKSGKIRGDRTGTGCASRFGDRLTFDLSQSFPLLTTKRVYWKGVFHELAWFLRGDTNTQYLKENQIRIWDEWALSEDDIKDVQYPLAEVGDVGPMYGSLWRSWSGDYTEVDQIWEVVHSIKKNPYSRRHVVSAWNPLVLPEEGLSPKQNVIMGNQALAPCHCLFQFFVQDGVLSCQLYQRSADIFLGVPFNIASYALLTHIIANICGLQVGKFYHTFGDLHLYANHLEAAEEQLSRSIKEAPQLRITRDLEVQDLNKLQIDDFEIQGYLPMPSIPAKISI